jgi:chromosome segregation protein
MLVTREAHVITRHSVSFFAPNAQMHGVLARRREIDELRAQLGAVQAELAERRAALATVQTQQEELEARTQARRQQQAELQAKRHQAQLEIVRMSELSERINTRAAQVASELAELARQRGMEELAQQHLQAQLDAAALEQSRVTAALADADAGYAQALQLLNERRAAQQEAERAAQAARFAEKSSAERIAHNEQELARVQRRLQELEQQQAALQAELGQLDDSALVGSLNAALSQREGADQALAQARSALEALTAQIAEVEGDRQTSEQKLEPLRESMNEVRLKEQEARLAETQFSEQLQAHGASDETLLPLLEKGARSSHLQTELNRLNGEVEALGPVNLAAVAEYDAAFERKNYLDAQSTDLIEAVETLENAIRRIDRETRELLRDTFEKVNSSFSTLFPQLFGGGRASIALTGEEILDAGLEVTAQPPGKKTSSIHLLSGGEKALTALSLVFSIFQLNPAPFCILDEVDAPLDDANTVRYCDLVKRMAENTQFLFISHNKLTMEMAEQLLGITMQESGVSRVVAVDMEQALRMRDEVAAA